jgi:hypothetical protein
MVDWIHHFGYSHHYKETSVAIQVTIRFDPRQQPETVLDELVSDLDAQVFEVHLEEAWWPWAGTDPFHISLLINAANELASGFFDEAGQRLFEWIRNYVLAVWKKPKLAGTPAPFELEIRTSNFQMVLRTPDASAVAGALNSAADAASRIIQAGHGQPVAMRFDPKREQWEETEPKDTLGGLLAVERKDDQFTK